MGGDEPDSTSDIGLYCEDVLQQKPQHIISDVDYAAFTKSAGNQTGLLDDAFIIWILRSQSDRLLYPSLLTAIGSPLDEW